MLYLSHDYIWSLDQRLRRLCRCWPLIICSHHVRFGYMRACEIRDITSYILHITAWLHDFVITWFCDFVIPWLWVWYTVHCVKIVQIWSFFWSVFSGPEKLGIWTLFTQWLSKTNTVSSFIQSSYDLSRDLIWPNYQRTKWFYLWLPATSFSNTFCWSRNIMYFIFQGEHYVQSW